MVGSSCFFTNKVKDLLENNHYLSFGGKKWRITIKTKARTRTDRVGEAERKLAHEALDFTER